MISSKPNNIPTSPGVYFFKDTADEIIYIGKAGNLKNRLSLYFSKQKKEPRTKEMLSEAAIIQWVEVGSEIEALIAEAEQIKFHEPKYNIALRDGKQYSYVVFSDDAFQRIYVTHQPQDNEQVIGPFVDSRALRSTLKHLRRIFPFCSCAQKHNNYCLNYHIGQCLGFCCLKNPVITDNQHQEYKDNVKAVKDILNGRKKSLIKEIETEMNIVAKEENFERAIVLRERLEKIKAVFENAKVIKEILKKYDTLAQMKRSLNLPTPPQRIEGYDISNIQGKFAAGSMIVFTDGNPNQDEYKKFRIRVAGEADDTKMLKEIITRRFNHPEWQYPNLIIIDGGRGQLNAVVSAVSKFKFPIIAVTKNQKHIGDHIFLSYKKSPLSLNRLPKSVKHLILHVDSEAHRYAIDYYRKLHRRTI